MDHRKGDQVRTGDGTGEVTEVHRDGEGRVAYEVDLGGGESGLFPSEDVSPE